MNSAFLKFYFDSTRYNLAFSILCLIISPLAGIVSFPTYGLVVGLFCYKQFHGHQYYFYYNLGLSRRKLIIYSFVINLNLSLLVMILLIAIL